MTDALAKGGGASDHLDAAPVSGGIFFAFRQRACAAFRAISIRSSRLSLAARVLPPRRPKALAASRIIASLIRFRLATREA